MKSTMKLMCAALVAGLGVVGTAQAAINTTNEVIFGDSGTVGPFTDASPAGDGLFLIAQSGTLTADQWYNLQARVVVLPGATLVIEPGVVFASGNAPGGEAGTLVVARGAQIIAEGTVDNPIIFTSRTDLANWADDASHPTGKNPRERGVWRQGAAEWGSLAVLGNARISDTRQNPSNGTAFDVSKEAPIEGLPTLAGGVNLYGGLADNDDSGVLSYISLSYGGDDFNPASNSELNGASFGGVGRGTDVSHIEIFNNIDDGLEIFGGSVNVKNLAVWNIGDDSLDIDQGYRGKLQFVFIVQGAAGSLNQGSGYGDNAVEADGADGDSTAQPVTAISLWNATVIGAPEVPAAFPGQDPDSSDHLVALRDNANVQFWNSIFMTGGGNVINNDGDDGDGSTGYGAAGSLSFSDRWSTPASYYLDPANGFANAGSAIAADFAAAYTAQDPAANLLQVAGSLFFGNESGAYGTAIAEGVVPAETVGSENVTLGNKVVGDLPIVAITRATVPGDFPFYVPSSDFGDGTIGNVMSIDPRAAEEALAVNRELAFQPPADGFYTTPTNFVGAVSPSSDWLQGWTGISAIDNNSAQKILASPARLDDPSGVALQLAPSVTFDTMAGVLYEVVAVDADNNERVVSAIVGTGAPVTVADNGPLDASAKYIVRIATH
ncbi:hypothetical protein [Mucisphaera sp.]|uniref:hypothetical protein n=1 Tax=Mucisphaera sp. TaxID=2913024 RepID=UPI003D0A6D52